MRESTLPEVQSVCKSAASATRAYAALGPEKRADFLDRIAEKLEGLAEKLIETACRETNLPQARITGERARTCGQLRMFANLIRSNDWLDLRIDSADPSRTSGPKPDLRRTQIPLGPVAVFGASNFPLAFSVPGGDTASALAAGCPVVCKAHPSHEETSQLCANAILEAARQTGMPEGVFSLIYGGAEVGQALVADENIWAVGFTGSQTAGRALFDLAAARPRPIPVHAEMGSVNPIFFLQSSLTGETANAYADSLTMGVGQFCTNPGVAVGISSPEFTNFIITLTEALKAKPNGAMLSSSIHAAYCKGVTLRSNDQRLETALAGEDNAPAIFKTTAERFIQHPELQEELFGPSALVVECKDFKEMQAVAEALEGQLTATIHFSEDEQDLARQLLPIVQTKAGRILANGFPTGVEVSPAMHHGGPYPATTDSRSTSVGTAAILRFVRPVAFQNFPTDLLPEELKG